MKTTRLLFATTLAAIATSLSAAEWPEWRGPGGQGHSKATGLPVSWSETKNVAWKAELPGRAWSSPVIEGRNIWLTTAIETPATKEDAARRLKANTGDQALTLLEKLELRALCVDRDTGKLTQNILLLSLREPQWVHALNSYASGTPVIEDGKLYCHFGALGNACLDTRAGKVLWTHTGLVVMHENGPGSTPVIWKNLMIFHLDGSDHQFIAALDKRTGKLAWKTPRSGEMNTNPQLKKSYGTPLLLAINGKEQIISPSSDWIYSYDELGRELWRVKYGQLGFSLTPRPVVGHGMIFMSTGYMKAQILALRYEGEKTPKIAWRYEKGAPTMPSPLLVGGELYFVNDGGIFTCLDAKTGAEHYRERLGGNYSSSPTFADGKIYVHNREGLTSVVKPGTKFEVLEKNPLPGKIFASLAAVDHALFLRTDTALYRIENKPATQAAR
ncbi:MAG: PQQ-binding-like beta-propeller repeat protein [Verrucomicrobia bacterium]|nr:PQQ-binding-like beta-propeller repeat protein [Verrucomicrobiota bacterium]